MLSIQPLINPAVHTLWHVTLRGLHALDLPPLFYGMVDYLDHDHSWSHDLAIRVL